MTTEKDIKPNVDDDGLRWCAHACPVFGTCADCMHELDDKPCAPYYRDLHKTLQSVFNGMMSEAQSMDYEPPESKLHRRQFERFAMECAHHIGGDRLVAMTADRFGWKKVKGPEHG